MKKKVLSLLLAVCLIVGMLPLAASAASGDPVENVSVAILHDPTGGVADDKLYDAGSYKVNATEGEDGIVNVAIEAKNLQKHAMGGEGALIAYWCGFAVLPPDGQRESVKKMQVGSGNTAEEASTAFDSAEPTELWGDVKDTNDGFAAYLNAGTIKNKVYKVQFLDEAGEAIEGLDPVVYNVTLNVTLAGESVVLPGYLHDTRVDGGLADDELYTSYDVAYEQKLDAANGGYYTEVTVNVKDLQQHQNGESNMGYWAGMFVVAPEYVQADTAKYKYAFATSREGLEELSTDSYTLDSMPTVTDEPDTVRGIGAYADLGKEPKSWLKVQWLDNSNKALNTTVYHMTFDYTLAQPSDLPDAPEALNVTPANLEDHTQGGPLVAKDQIATNFRAFPGEAEWDATKNVWVCPITVTADTLKVHTNAQDNVGYWIGPAIEAPEGAEKMKVVTGLTLGEVLDVSSEENTAIELCQKIQLKAKDISAPPSSLSGGNQQKVVFAKLLNCDLKVLILDEPTKGIDVGAKYSIYEIMNELTANGYAIIMVSSEMPEVLGMADRIVVMRNGRVAGQFESDGTTQEMILEASLKHDDKHNDGRAS